MVYHRQLKLKSNGKPILLPTLTEVKRRKIKHLQRYKKKIENAELKDLPAIINQMYTYIINKSILTDEEFLKNEIIEQLDLIVDAFKHSYPIQEPQKLKDYIMSRDILGLYENSQKTETNLYNEFVSFLNLNFYAVKFTFLRYKTKKIYKKLKNGIFNFLD